MISTIIQMSSCFIDSATSLLATLFVHNAAIVTLVYIHFGEEEINFIHINCRRGGGNLKRDFSSVRTFDS